MDNNNSQCQDKHQQFVDCSQDSWFITTWDNGKEQMVSADDYVTIWEYLGFISNR